MRSTLRCFFRRNDFCVGGDLVVGVEGRETLRERLLRSAKARLAKEWEGFLVNFVTLFMSENGEVRSTQRTDCCSSSGVVAQDSVKQSLRQLPLLWRGGRVEVGVMRQASGESEVALETESSLRFPRLPSVDVSLIYDDA